MTERGRMTYQRTGREIVEDDARDKWDGATWQARMSFIDEAGDRRLLNEFLQYLRQKIKNNSRDVSAAEAACAQVCFWLNTKRPAFVQRQAELFEESETTGE